MRLWHYELLPYLPDLQFKGQLREIVAIMHDWRDKGSTNHILVNRVMDYPKLDLYTYFRGYCREYNRRYGGFVNSKYDNEFFNFLSVGEILLTTDYMPYKDWHNKEYLRVCMANLCEKHFFGKGKHQITEAEWQRLLDGYKAITGEDYVL